VVAVTAMHVARSRGVGIADREGGDARGQRDGACRSDRSELSGLSGTGHGSLLGANRIGPEPTYAENTA